MGSYRSSSSILKGPDLLRTLVLLPRWCTVPALRLPHFAEVAELIHPLRQVSASHDRASIELLLIRSVPASLSSSLVLV